MVTSVLSNHSDYMAKMQGVEPSLHASSVISNVPHQSFKEINPNAICGSISH